MSKIPVLCVLDYYAPGFRGGGPIRTIENLARMLDDDVHFWIVTRDHDLGSEDRYPGVRSGEWNTLDCASVSYEDDARFGVRSVIEKIKSGSCQIIYLNSFFSFKSSISIYVALKKLRGSKVPVILAPRGEFSRGALDIKRVKKAAYIFISRLLNLYGDVIWHASTQDEKQDILRVFPRSAGRIYIAEDPVDVRPITVGERPAQGEAGSIRIAFVSRISRKKNLSYLLTILSSIQCSIQLSIFGPIEDEEYWQGCQSSIRSLPDNVAVHYEGVVLPDQVTEIFSKYDVFAFPTFGENFGHVIFESLRAGTPVLVSDQTPWRADADGALTVIPLETPEAWREAIEHAASRDGDARREVREATLDYARRYAMTRETRLDNLRMFVEVAGGKREKDSNVH